MDRKRRALTGAGIELPAHVVYVPFDFDRPDLGTELGGALEIAGFKRGEGAMQVWEGVIGYIDNAAIDRSLRFIASAGGQGSREPEQPDPLAPELAALSRRRARATAPTP